MVLLFFLLPVLPAALFAQTPQPAPPAHTLSGTVLDPSSADVADAQVTLVTANGSVQASTITDRAGYFFFDDLPHGKYRLRIHAAGFKDGLVEVTIGAKPLLPLRISLAISAVSEVVSVTADENIPQTSTDPSENLNANNITRDALDRVPVFDLDYITLLSRFLSDDAIASSGVSLVVNGVEANGPGVSASAVQEVKINQNPYSARFARPGRARVEITTKAGTPAYHGTVNFLTRNSVFDASNFFAPTKPSESRYMEEGSFTGPLGRDKRNTFLLSLEQDNDNLQAVVHAFGSPVPPTTNPVDENVPAPQRHFFGSFRAFHDFDNGDQVWVGYSYEDQKNRNQGVGGIVLPEAGYTTGFTEHEINVSYRHIFSTKWVNQLRFLFGHNDNPTISNVAAPQIAVQGIFTGGGAQADLHRTEAHFDGTDFVAYTSGRHMLVFGVDVPDLSRRGSDDFTNQQGTYTFADINSFNANQAAGFRIQTGNGHLVFWERIVSGFIEDSVRIKPNLSFTLGVRYYFQNYFNNDANNFAPRFAFAWAPKPQGKIVFRGGAGVFYDRSGNRAIADLLHYDGKTLLRQIVTPPPGGFVPYPIPPADLDGVPTSLVVLDPRVRIPQIVQYSFGIERQITAKSTLSATYVGTRGIDLFMSRDINAPLAPDYLARPNAEFGQIRQMESEGYQKGNSLEVTFRGKPTKFLAGQAQYTLGKSYNNTSGLNYFPGNSNFPNLDWARSDNDRRHKLDLLGTFEPTSLLTFGVALQAYSGKPVNVTTGQDLNGDGVFNDRPDGGLASRNSLHGPGLLNLDVNVAHDFHFKKEKKDGPVLTAALNIFNVLNHPNYVTFIGVIGPDGGPFNPNFGFPAAANPGRRFQLNLECKF
ncbi:MAG TPA: carboxypeptidase regulatory-like domain-containing protein [Candidatus Limnocylindrales bacterium]|nr:carboxypeptidase regulatory-like domain-containing protein [Candidatus Limnocylindrales bacterium]